MNNVTRCAVGTKLGNGGREPKDQMDTLTEALPPHAYINVIVGRNIQAMRQNSRLACLRFADMCGLTAEELRQVEAGEKRLSGEQIITIVRALNRSVADFFYGVEQV